MNSTTTGRMTLSCSSIARLQKWASGDGEENNAAYELPASQNRQLAT